MGGTTLITHGLALCCAARMRQIAQSDMRWSGEAVIFRAGALMPSDLFASPSLREAFSYVTITPMTAGYERLATPLGRNWSEDFRLPPVMEVSPVVSGLSIRRLSPRAAPGIVGIFWERGDGKTFSGYRVVQDEETPEDVVAAFCKVFAGARADGPVLRVPSGRLEAQVVGYGRSTRLASRQSQSFRLSIWTDRCTMRAALGTLLNDRLLPEDWLDLPDGRCAQVIFDGEEEHDEMQTQILFRRDIRVRVIWDRWETDWTPQMIAGGGWLRTAGSIQPWGVTPGNDRSEIPVDTLVRLSAQQDMPMDYRDWCVDSDGTVIWSPSSAGGIS